MTQTPSENWKYFFWRGRAKTNTAVTVHTTGNMYSTTINHGRLYQDMVETIASRMVAMKVTTMKLATQPQICIASVYRSCLV